jgi:catechol 2,3-dioxygenase-like lactoylglutathione lyase family enzyme
MKFEMSNCIALGVGEMLKAAEFYEGALGFERVQERPDWIELKSGQLRIFVCNDDVGEPVFDLRVGDVEASLRYLLANGFSRVVFDEDDRDVFVRDPFGYAFCLTKAD